MGIPFAGYVSPASLSRTPSSSLGSPPPLETPTDSGSESSAYTSDQEIASNTNIMNTNSDLATPTEDSPPSPDANLEDPDSRDQANSPLAAPAPGNSTNSVAPYRFRASTVAQRRSRHPLPRGIAPIRAPNAAAAVLRAALSSLPTYSTSFDAPANPAPTSVQLAAESLSPDGVQGPSGSGLSAGPTQSERAHDAYQAGLHPNVHVPPVPPSVPINVRAHPGFHSPPLFGPIVGQIRPYAYDPPARITPSHQLITLQGNLMVNTVHDTIIYQLNDLRERLELVQRKLGPVPYQYINGAAGELANALKTLKTLRRNTFAALEDYHLIKTYNNDPVVSGYSPTFNNPALQA